MSKPEDYETAPTPQEAADRQRKLSTTPANRHGECPVTRMTTDAGALVADNQNSLTAGPRGPLLAQDVWLHEKLGNFVREVIPERRMHAKGSGAFGTFTVTHDITKYTRAKIFSEVGKKTVMFARFTTVAGERGAADAERFSWLPATCAYRLVSEGKDLPLWHHLVCGDTDAVHRERISQAGRMLAEDAVPEDEGEAHLIFRAG